MKKNKDKRKLGAYQRELAKLQEDLIPAKTRYESEKAKGYLNWHAFHVYSSIQARVNELNEEISKLDPTHKYDVVIL